MELICKVTELCNFKCTFCSSSDISKKATSILDLNYIFDFLHRYPDTSTIIINGGDPLMVDPKYYWNIINYLDVQKMDTSISFTTNLWAFYKDPEKWVELFNHPRIGVTTSFNFGDTRRITEDKVFTKPIFINVVNRFFRYVGYRPDFISVISEENQDTAIKNVVIAASLDVECKLNYAMASGKQSKPFPLSKMYEIYIDVWKNGFTQWEYNTKQMIDQLQGTSTTCPQNRSCDSGIRAFNPEGDYYTCGAFGDDKLYSINFEQEMSNGEQFTPLRDAVELSHLKDDCLACSMFTFCNGCYKTIKDMKQHNMVDEHCASMKQLEPEFDKIRERLI